MPRLTGPLHNEARSWEISKKVKTEKLYSRSSLPPLLCSRHLQQSFNKQRYHHRPMLAHTPPIAGRRVNKRPHQVSRRLKYLTLRRRARGRGGRRWTGQGHTHRGVPHKKAEAWHRCPQVGTPETKFQTVEQSDAAPHRCGARPSPPCLPPLQCCC